MASKIEPKIEALLSEKMQNPEFLAGVADAYFKAPETAAGSQVDKKAIKRQIEALTAKRTRVLETYFDGVIDREVRDERVNAIDAELSTYRSIETPPAAESEIRNIQGLADLLSVFAEIRYLDRADKRILMRGCNARIYLDGYTVKGLEMAGMLADSAHNDSHLRTAP